MQENDTGRQTAESGRIDYSVLNKAVGYRLRIAQLQVFQDFAEAFTEDGLRPADFSVLLIISENPGLKQREVAEALGIQRANFVAIADNLEQRGLAERRRTLDDRRILRFYLTEQGKTFVAKMLETWHDHEEKIISRLGGEAARDQLLELLSRLTSHR